MPKISCLKILIFDSKNKSNMISFLRNLLSTIIGIVLSFLILLLVIVGGVSLIDNEGSIEVKEESVLKIDFTNLQIVERVSENPLNALELSGPVLESISLKDILDNIEKAKTDNNIKGIHLKSSSVIAGMSQTEEVRNKLLEFRNSGKFIIAYDEGYTQMGYYLSSVADRLYMHPEGIIDIRGFSASIMFFKGLLEKLDIDVQIIRHGKFKSAVEPFILEKMSPENREQTRLFLNSIADNIMDSIASQRGMALLDVQRHANELSLETAKSCYDLSYVDALIYEDQLIDTISKMCQTKEYNTINLNKYKKVKIKKKDISRNKIAIIYATGEISSGEGDESSIGSITTASAIKKAREDKGVKAIVLRVNSPGGSALASDVIWRETILAKKEKPLVVSMGDLAASGGYYISCAADTIIANPTTITGSIGVFGMIPNLQRFYKNKMGVTIDVVKTNRYSDMGSNRPLTKYELNKIQKSVEDVYDTFITHVGEGRSMTKVAVDEIGQGRIWTGHNAKDIGLVDLHGGLEKALEVAAYLAKIDDYRVISLPRKKDPYTKIMEKLGSNTNFKDIVLRKLGFQMEYINTLEHLVQGDRIQARIPYIIELEK